MVQRKKMVQESPGSAREDDKTKKLRKRNTELVALVKTLDEKYKNIKSDYEQLVRYVHVYSHMEVHIWVYINPETVI